ncbi:PspC domain-containing protein [Micromonospora echinospora]|uniref:Phage shock protein PspC (Stress-responsive transcriptional regulator) n=1 Tax=Micromonospora echinospora TaxID=1877 RepID=A0ABR6MLI7_MICEC|nr:PspC domain-containing protein [Micromonospora echinospora]MBB5116236.1 phage shock protein PspC (stress-responsive transcriptional regulator) [Micromonospora echinospora]
MTEDAARPPRPWAAAQDAPPPPPPGSAPPTDHATPPPGGAPFTGPPPGGYAPPPGAAGFTTRYGLVRPREGRYLAGVCAAIGRATNTDPVLWRVLLAVLGFFGGIGIIVYVAGWLIIPGEGDTASPVEAMLGRGRSSMSPITVIVLGIVVALGFAYVVTDGFRAILLGAVILIGGALLLNREQRGPGQRPAQPTPQPGPPPGPVPPVAWPAPPASAPGAWAAGPAGAPWTAAPTVRPEAASYAEPGYPPAGRPEPGYPPATTSEPGYPPASPSEPGHPATSEREPGRPATSEREPGLAGSGTSYPTLPAPGWPAAAGTRPGWPEPTTAALPPVSGPVADTATWPAYGAAPSWPGTRSTDAPLGGPAAVPPPGPVGAPLPPGGYRPPFAPHGPYAGSPPPRPPVRAPRPPKRPKERSPLGAITFSLIFLALGVVAMLDLLDVFPVGAAGYFAAVLATIGLGLLVGTWFGRARWLIALGLVTAAALGVATIAESYDRVRGIDGNVTWAPTDLRDLANRYENNLGDAVLDLRGINFDKQDVQVTVDVNLGNATVVVPPNVDVTTVADVNAGDATVFGRRSGGLGGRQWETTDVGADGPGGGKLRLFVHVNAGKLEVTR